MERKSEIVKQVAEKLGLPVVDAKVSTAFEPSDYVGLPIIAIDDVDHIFITELQ